MRRAARDLKALGPSAALVKGGHQQGDAVDVLCDGRGTASSCRPRASTHAQHARHRLHHSAAIAAQLALGDSPATRSVREAVVTEAIRHSYAVGRGRPLGHFHSLHDRDASGGWTWSNERSVWLNQACSRRVAHRGAVAPPLVGQRLDRDAARAHVRVVRSTSSVT